MKIPYSAAAVALLPALAWATPQGPIERRAAAGPTVTGTAPKATYVGTSAGQVESFKGIPFAQSVAGKNRLTAPKAITKGLGTVQATQNGPGCPSQNIVPVNFTGLAAEVVDTLFATAQGESEDCL